MNMNANQVLQFEDVFELTYELLSELDLEVFPDGSIVDVDNNVFFFNGMKVIANIDPRNIHYAGQGEIMFDLIANNRLSTVLFGNYLERKIKDGMAFVSYFPDEKIIVSEKDDIPDTRLFNLTVKFDNIHELASPYFKIKSLTYIWMIFALEEEMVDLSNFDTEEYMKK